MDHNINGLIGYKIGAINGEIGSVKDFYFDDDTWTIRYMIVDTGEWLSSRKILVSPQAVVTTDCDNRIFHVDLFKDQIKSSPDVDTERPVSRQDEIKLQEHYRWSGYLDNGLYTGNAPVSVYEVLTRNADYGGKNKSIDDPHLRSTGSVIGYTVKAIDGDIGDVNDLIMSDTTWQLDFMIVDTGRWWPGRRVLISPKWIKAISWKENSVVIVHNIETVKSSPEYMPNQPLSSEYLLKVYSHFKDLQPI